MPSVVLAQSFAVTYTYDSQGRLSEAVSDEGTSVKYSYDNVGNLTTVVTESASQDGVEASGDIPARFALYESYPNPFNPVATIAFDVKEVVLVKLTVFDLLGKEVTKLVNRVYFPGRYKAKFEPKGLASGLYFYRIEMGAFRDVKKMLLIK